LETGIALNRSFADDLDCLVGDFQTEAPTHGGLSDFGRSLMAACNAKGVLVDLAHCTRAGITQALAVAKVPVVFSHGPRAWSKRRRPRRHRQRPARRRPRLVGQRLRPRAARGC